MSEIAKKFYEWCEGKKPESDSGEAQKQVQVDGVAHNRQELKKQEDFKQAGRTSSEPRNKGVSGFFGRVELTEETFDGKIITHVKGVPVPAGQDKSVGPEQMQVGNIRKLAEKYPNVLDAAGDALSNAIKPDRAPYFVGAYFADVINGIENHKKPDYITVSTWKSVNEHWQKGEKNEALILAYNPSSSQVNHVFTQMDAIKARRKKNERN
jgi:hypothetical protein